MFQYPVQARSPVQAGSPILDGSLIQAGFVQGASSMSCMDDGWPILAY